MPNQLVYEFVGTCDHLPADELHAFDDTSRKITNRTFRKHLGRQQYTELKSNLGYARWLRLAKDYHVYYDKGLWEGRRAVCLFWSEIHHIFAVP